MFVYREQYYLEKQPKLGSIEHAGMAIKMNDVNGLADIIIGKQRHGPTGNVKVEFEGSILNSMIEPKINYNFILVVINIRYISGLTCFPIFIKKLL